ncbi:MAG: DUF1223 domain-containing protein [Halobacteriovoraceae bacterium]|nr:DUF1223 domain-containing protein [Halobacteriovoraceae bacterium]MCB9095292.1 DUF1223 domain-containing protein [Halobacteriovoraceae bacterium]
MNYWVLVVFFLNASLSLAQEWESGVNQVSLVELFTSESCSSCPPAEKWLNGMIDDEGLWKNYVPVEYHVDYWNHLSWKDPFSKELFTERQRTYAKQLKSKSVFTPQILVNGISNIKATAPYPEARKTKVGQLKVKFNSKEDVADVVFTPAKKNLTKFKCEGALLGGGFQNKIKAGENSGKNLSHEFVVLTLSESLMKKMKNRYTCSLKLSTPNTFSDVKKKAIGVWIKEKASGKILQATGGFLSGFKQ